jgi:tetratricopeptide (TPR) repeat protein
MREGPGSAIFLLVGLGCAALAAAGQKPAPQSEVTVFVVNALPQPPQPVSAVRVSLSYLESAVLVTGAQQVTNSQGQAPLVVSADAAERGDLRIGITGAGDLVIYEPADGQLPALPAKLTIRLLPKGSTALLGPAQIEAMLHRSLLEVNTLQKQVAEQKRSAAQQQQKPDLGPSIAEWAQVNGFSSAEVDQQVQQWAEGIQKQSGQATQEQKALAELALKHYENAARLFNAAGDAERQQITEEDSQEENLEAQVKALEAAQQALLDKQRSSLRHLLDDSEQAAGADQLNLQYRPATQTLESAAATAQGEFKKHPGDKGFHELWLRAVSNTADARRKEGEIAPASESLPLLAQSADDFRSLAREYGVLGDQRGAAAAQDGLGVALLDEGVRAGADLAMGLLDQAAAAFQDALRVRSRADLPQDWARTQVDLGLALMNEGQRTTGDKAMALFDQAAAAYRNALTVYTRADLPRNWAATENDLGIVLVDEGGDSSSDKSAELFDEAVRSYQNALDVYTRADLPQEWAGTQTNLGNVLMQEGERAVGDKAAALFARSVTAYQNALEVYTKAGLPQAWAGTQLDLGGALVREAEETNDGDHALSLYDQAVQAFENALEVYTKADLPQIWATAENDLGGALDEEAQRAPGDKADALFAQAVEAFQRSLEVRPKAELPQDWASSEANLANTLLDEGERASGDKARALLDQAIQAYQDVLQIYTKAAFPQDWAMTQLALMEATLVSARFKDCYRQAEALDDASVWASLDFTRDVMRLACAAAAGERAAAGDVLNVLSVKASAVKKGVNDYTGILCFLSNSPAFDKGRASWIALFTAVQNGDSAGLSAALKQLEPILEQ